VYKRKNKYKILHAPYIIILYSNKESEYSVHTRLKLKK